MCYVRFSFLNFCTQNQFIRYITYSQVKSSHSLLLLSLFHSRIVFRFFLLVSKLWMLSWFGCNSNRSMDRLTLLNSRLMKLKRTVECYRNEGKRHERESKERNISNVRHLYGNVQLRCSSHLKRGECTLSKGRVNFFMKFDCYNLTTIGIWATHHLWYTNRWRAKLYLMKSSLSFNCKWIFLFGFCLGKCQYN